jgi:SAM-dependent methyltransferase
MPTPPGKTFTAVEWLSETDRLRYADYWNDQDEEKQKPFWVLDGKFSRMEAYLEQIGLPAQMAESIRVARESFGRAPDGIGIDLGAGTLWAVPHLFRLGRVDHVYCVEYSRHRLFTLGPAVLTHYGVPPAQVTLVLGDIHRLRLKDASVDFVFMSAAFHHSDTPETLLAEIRRVLRPAGLVIIVGEHISDIGARAHIRHMLKFLVASGLPHVVQRRLFGRVIKASSLIAREQDLLAGDDRLGDHAYTLTQYERLFAEAGFISQTLRRPRWAYQAFILVPRGSRAV